MTDRTAVALLSMLVLWQTGAAATHDCKDGRTVTVEEGDQVSLTCAIPDAGYLAWSLTIRGSDEKVSTDQVGNCAVRGNGSTVCQVEDTADYELTSQGLPTSTLTIRRSPSTATVLCTGILHSSEEPTHACYIEVHYPAHKVRNCSLQWNATDGSVFGSCDVDKISPEDGEYACLWSHEISQWKVRINKHHSEELGNHSVRCMFQGYVLSKANRTGSFSLWISRGPTSVWLYAKRFPVEKPGEPEFANCPTAVTEGSDFTCLCRPSSSRPGTPRPVVTWIQGSPNNPLRLSDVKRGLDGLKYTCYQYWGGWNDGDVETTSYTMHVNYPPGLPYFPQKNAGFLPLPNHNASTIFCQVRDGNPGVQAASLRLACAKVHNFSDKAFLVDKVWTIQLTFTPTLPEHNGSVCTCSVMTETPAEGQTHKTAEVTVLVMEAPVPKITTISKTTSKRGKVATTPTTVSSSGGTKDPTDDESDHGPPIVIIASTAAGGLVVIIVIIVIIVVVVVVLKRRGGARSTTDRSTKDKDADFEEYINDLYVSSDQCLSIHPHPHPPAAHLPDPTNQRAAAAAVSPASRDGGNAVDRDQETSFRSSTVPLARSGPAASRDRPTTNQNAGEDFEECINDLYVSSDQCLSIHPHPHPPAAHLPDPTNRRAAAAAVSPASRDGENAVDRDQETSFRSSTVPLARSGPAASRDGLTTNQNAGADFEEYINDLYVSSDQCLSIHPHPHPPAAHLPDPTNQRAAAAAVSPASRDGGNAVDRDQETSFRSSTVPLSPSGPAASRDGATTNQNAGAGPSREDEIPSDQGREPQEKTSTANNEDKYNVLNFHRGAPKTFSIDTDAVYSHIDAVGKKP